MKIEQVVSNTEISKDAAILIHSGLAPIYLGTETEVYELASIVEWMESAPLDFSEKDKVLIKTLNKDHNLIEIHTENHRDFKKILGF